MSGTNARDTSAERSGYVFCDLTRGLIDLVLDNQTPAVISPTLPSASFTPALPQSEIEEDHSPLVLPDWLPPNDNGPGPGGYGPPPLPTSAKHAARLPELQVRGGQMQFAHDAGMIRGSPQWFVGGKEVKDTQRLIELFTFRGISEDTAKAAECAFDFVLGWSAPLSVEKRPIFWDISPALGGITPFSEPFVEILTDPKQETEPGLPRYGRQGIIIARTTYWRKIDRETQVTHPTGRILGPRGMDMGPAPPFTESIEQWAEWTLCIHDIQLSRHGTGKYDDEHPGYDRGYSFKQSAPCWRIITTPDGLHSFTPRD